VRLPDVNILLYAVDEGSVRHEPARAWVEERLSGTETFALVDGWLAQPCATVVHPTSRHASVLRELLEPLGTAGNLTTDAHLAALAIEHGAELCSTDGDFSRFPGLRWANPLEA
jgi:predicted nucleic acid-binding protein